MSDGTIQSIVGWAILLVVAAGWYFARKGRRIREAKEAEERAGQARVNDALKAADKLVGDFGGFMETIIQRHGGDPTMIFDSSLLPAPKGELRNALTLAAMGATTAKERGAIAYGLMFLCHFQEGVGAEPLNQLGTGVAVNRLAPDLDALKDDPEKLREVAATIVAGKSGPRAALWEGFNVRVKEEMEQTQSALGRIDSLKSSSR